MLFSSSFFPLFRIPSITRREKDNLYKVGGSAGAKHQASVSFGCGASRVYVCMKKVPRRQGRSQRSVIILALPAGKGGKRQGFALGERSGEWRVESRRLGGWGW